MALKGQYQDPAESLGSGHWATATVLVTKCNGKLPPPARSPVSCPGYSDPVAERGPSGKEPQTFNSSRGSPNGNGTKDKKDSRRGGDWDKGYPVGTSFRGASSADLGTWPGLKASTNAHSSSGGPTAGSAADPGVIPKSSIDAKVLTILFQARGYCPEWQ